MTAASAFADSIVDFADWLARCEPAVPARGPSSTEAGRRKARELFEQTRKQREADEGANRP